MTKLYTTLTALLLLTTVPASADHWSGFQTTGPRVGALVQGIFTGTITRREAVKAYQSGPTSARTQRLRDKVTELCGCPEPTASSASSGSTADRDSDRDDD